MNYELNLLQRNLRFDVLANTRFDITVSYSFNILYDVYDIKKVNVYNLRGL